MSQEGKITPNDKLVRELKQKIIDLTGDFDKRFGKVSRKIEDKTVRHTRMSIYTDDRQDDRFYHKLQSFNIDKENDTELREMVKNLTRLQKTLERRLKDLRFAKEDYEIEDISLEIQKAIQDSPIMQRLFPEELRQRIENLTYTSDMTKIEYIRLLKAEIKQINFERDSAKAVIVANSDPELKKTFDELLRCSELITEEMEYRDAQREVTRSYNELCRGYQAIEKIDRELSDSNIPEKRRTQLVEHRKKAVHDVKKSMTTKEKVNEEGVMKVLKNEIEALAFEKNALNGIVDPEVVARDKFTVIKADCFLIFDKFENLTELEKSRKKRPILNEDPDFAEYTKRVELKMLMQKLALTYQEKADLDKIKARLEELNAKKDLTPAELEERSRLSKQQINIHRQINKISNTMDRIKTLGNELGIPCIMDGSLDLNSKEQLNGIGVMQVETSMKNQKKRALKERKKVCEKYLIDATLNDTEVTKAIDEIVAEIETQKGRRIINLDYEDPADVNAPESVEGVTATATYLENREREGEGESYSYQDKKVVQKMEIYDVQAQLDTNDPQYKQRVELGKVYRYEKGAKDGELLFIEEDLEVYLENPKKKLNQILNGLRSRVRDEFSSEIEFENYCDTNIKSDEFRGLLSKNPIKRMSAKKTLLKKLEQANSDMPSFAYINMAIALNSEILPDAIDETLCRTAQPYGDRESDMKKYVKIKGKSAILGIGRHEQGEIVRSRLSDVHFKNAREEERFSSSIDLNVKDDGMVRPFEITESGRGNIFAEKEEPQNNKTRKRTRSRSCKDKSQDGEIE